MTPEDYEKLIKKQEAQIEFYKELSRNYQDYARRTPEPALYTLIKYLLAGTFGYLLASRGP